MMFDLKGHIRSKKAIYVYLFSLNSSSVKSTHPLMLPPNSMCASPQPDCSLDVKTRNKFFIKWSVILNYHEATFIVWRGWTIKKNVLSFDQIITLTYVLMDNFCTCLFICRQRHFSFVWNFKIFDRKYLQLF